MPVYLHPSFPHQAVIDVYYKDYLSKYPELVGPALGFTVEAATQGVRMVLSGLFDAYPKLRVILGHLGEGIPFLLGRIDETLSRPGNPAGSFREKFCEHFYLTTSGNFSTNALVCSMMEMGVDRIMFSVDWPFAPNKMGTDWLEAAPISRDDKVKIFGGNARRLQPGRAAAHHRHAPRRARRAAEGLDAALEQEVRRVALQEADRDRLVLGDVAHAGALAQDLGRADARAGPAEDVLLQDGGRRALEIAGLDLADEVRDVDARRAGLDAARAGAAVVDAGRVRIQLRAHE